MKPSFTPPLLSPFLFLTFFSLYLFTAPPTVYSMDSGEFAGAAYFLGIAHSPGYPGYLLLAKLFTLLPLTSVVFALNLGSAFFAALTLPLLERALSLFLKLAFSPKSSLTSFLQITSEEGQWGASFGASALFGLSSTFWVEANIAEQYSLHILTFLVVFYALLRFISQGDARHLLAAAFAGGFAIAVHPLILAYAGTLLFLVILRDARVLSSTLILPLGFFFFLGYSVHLLLPLRAAAFPWYRWGVPESLRQFLYLITAEETRQSYPFVKQWLNVKSPILGMGLLEPLFLFFPIGLGFIFWKSKVLFGKILRTSVLGLLLLTLYILLATPFLDPTLSNFSKSVWLDHLLIQFSFVLFPLLLFGGWVSGRAEPHLFFALLYFFFMAFPYNVSANFGHNNPILQERHKMVGYLALTFFLAAGLAPLLGFLKRFFGMLSRPRFFSGALFLLPLSLFLYHGKSLNRAKASFVRTYAEDILASVHRGGILFVKGPQLAFPLWYLQQVKGKRRDVKVILTDALSTSWYVQDLRTRFPHLLPKIPAYPRGDLKSLKMLQARGQYLNRVFETIVKSELGKAPIYYTAGPSDFLLDPLRRYRVVPQGLVFRILSPKEPLPGDLEDIQDLLLHYRSPSELKAYVSKDWMARYYYRSFAMIHSVLARDAATAGDRELAEQELREALRYAPDSVPVLKALAILQSSSNPDQALSLFKRLTKMAPEDPQIWNNLGALQEQMGKKKEAERSYRRAIEKAPNYPDAKYNLALLLLRHGEEFTALSLLKSALKLAPYDLEIRVATARLLDQLKKPKEAEQALLEGLKKYPSGDLMQALISFYRAHHEPAKAAHWEKEYKKYEKARSAP